jgi:hypothetical protein
MCFDSIFLTLPFENTTTIIFLREVLAIPLFEHPHPLVVNLGQHFAHQPAHRYVMFIISVELESDRGVKGQKNIP